MKTTISCIVVAATLAGCASYSGIMALGDDTYFVSKQAATGFGGMGNLKAEIIADAQAYCAHDGQKVHIVQTSESAPPYVLGNYPRAELHFQCVAQTASRN